jgi:hypothetical protein
MFYYKHVCYFELLLWIIIQKQTFQNIKIYFLKKS